MEKKSLPLLDDIYSQIGFGKFHIIVILILGFIQCFDAAELILLAFLGPILTCSWKISLMESSLIAMSVFAGMIGGSLTFGKLSDIYGRKKLMLLGVCGIFYFSLLCSMSPTVLWVILTRALIGLFIGGSTIMVSAFLTELMPINHRGTAQMSVQVFWSVGSYYISLFTILLVPAFGWRVWLLMSVLPMIFVIPTIIWLPESPRYLLIKSRNKEAVDVINQIALMNNAEPILKVQNIEYKESSPCDIFHRNYALTTIITTYICFVTGLSYYGIVLSASIINDIPHKCLQDMSRTNDMSEHLNKSVDNSCCFTQNWKTMETVFISISGELLSYLFGIILIQFIKRKLYLQILMLVNTIVFFFMNLCLSPTYAGIIMMFGRGSSVAMLGVQYLYISEVFPTNIRSFGLGLGSGSARLGAIVSSFIVNIYMVKISFMGSTMLYCVLNVVGIFLICLLPYETKDRALFQNIEEEISILETTKNSK